MFSSRLLRPFVATSVFFAASSIASASILVHEAYDYSGLTDGDTMAGVSASAVGLTGDYMVGGTGQGAMANYVSTGLTFVGTGFHPTSGGAVSLSAPGTGSSSSTLNVELNAGAVTGTVYSSYLFQFTAASGAAGATAQVYKAPTVGGAKGLLTLADGNNSTTAAERVQAQYSGALATSGSTPVELGLNTTYLAIAKFTNVGVALSPDTPGLATFWILDLAGYDAWVAGGAEEENLTANALSFVTTAAVTSGTVDLSGFQGLAVSNNGLAGTTTQTVIFDELTYGTTLADVTTVAVPEPSTLALLLGSAGMLAFRSRRRKSAR